MLDHIAICPALFFSTILSGAASGQPRTLNLRRSRLCRLFIAASAVGHQLPATLNSCGRLTMSSFLFTLA